MALEENLRIGFNGRFFASNWRPALEEIAFAQACHFTALQVPGKEEGLQVEHLGADMHVIREAMARTGIIAVMEIVIRVDGSGRTETGKTPIEILTANLPAISALSCRCVHWHLVPEASLDIRAIRELEARLIPQFTVGMVLAEQHDFHFGFEHNEPDLLLFGTPNSCTRLLTAVPNLSFVWDFNHTIPDHIDSFQSLIPRMRMVHISDTPLPEVNYHLPLGLGRVDIDRYCHALSTARFTGPAILEIGGLPKSGGYGRDTDEALTDSYGRLRKASQVHRPIPHKR